VSFPAYALVLGNPGHSFKKGVYAAGVGLGDNRIEFLGNIGLGEAGVLDLFIASEDVSVLVERDEFGVGYRQNLGKEFTLAGMKMRLGILTQFRQGTISSAGQELDYQSFDLGVGGFITLLEGLNVYAAGVYERIEAEQNVTGVGVVSVTDTNLGLLVGVDFTIGESFMVGAEIHPRLEEREVIFSGLFIF
jgi:hypothetical protein